MLDVLAHEPPPADTGTAPRQVSDTPGRADRMLTALAGGAGLFVLLLLALIGSFLFLRAAGALQSAGFGFFTTVTWRPDLDPPVFGVLGLLAGTVTVALIAVSVAIPVSLLAALFITEYANPRLAGLLRGLVDLLAAIPSLLYGLWGFAYLGPKIVPLSGWLNEHVSWIPLFRTAKDAQLLNSYFIAGIVVSLMVLPIITSVLREVLAQTPPGEKEAALALGATRWGMIRAVVLPFGRGGVIGGSMLGLGRALGETIAVSLLLPQVPKLSLHILEFGGGTISGFLAVNAGINDSLTGALMAFGLILFIFTLATNFIASVIISRSRSGVGVDA